MAATKMFFRSGFEVQMTSMKSRRLRGSLPDDFQEVVWTSRKSSELPGSRLDFLEVVWTFWKSSGLHGSLLTKSPFHNRSERFGFSDLEDLWDDLPVSRLKYNALDDFQESSGLPESLLTKSSSISSGVQACLCREMIYNSFTTYNSVVRQTTYLRLNFQSSQKTDFKVNCKNNLFAQCGEKVRDMLCLVHKNGKRRRVTRFWEH
ncbi:hypothetical protein IGI04_023308 [Brassica rapa subsp. trilocularis]|uniref:Uncharacterized protein n=1 Tax=Brassica rapa subsp. trilocularis TaxID=1813537 RepID=A0ABQ7M3G6_BRACM|nr:hypothetical protein IGI04_023308 [Brassica rapa subsp. trilocularis]